MTKKLSVTVLMLIVAVSFCAVATHADMSRSPMCKGMSGHGMKMDKKMDLEEKFLYKAKKILKNKDELGLSDRQINRIKKLKVSVKKDIINKNAQIDILKVDINTGDQ